MISPLAGECLGLIKGLQVCFPHRRPDGATVEEWEQAISELVAHVLKLDEEDNMELLSLLKLGLTEQWDCFTGEQVVVDMGLTTLAHLDG